MARLLSYLCLVFWSSALLAAELEDVSRLLERSSAPVGVVFEMVGGDAESLNIALRRTETYVVKLKKKFPDAKFVILSHGLEQFSLLQHNKDDNPNLHQRVERLVKDEKIPIQVCGAFAEMSDVDDRDFIKSVQVVDSAPLQIQEYVEQGYVVIEMELH